MIYVTGDIHGNLTRFNSIMEQIKLRPADTLNVLGDVIDRFPYGIQILRKLMGMSNVKIILGNHEYMMLNAVGKPGEPKTQDENATDLWYQNGGKVTHDALKRLRIATRKEIFQYLRALPLNIDLTVNGVDYKLVHGAPVGEFTHYLWEYDDQEQFILVSLSRPQAKKLS